MDENDKIKQIIQKYDAYFKNGSGDAVLTATGYWLFFEYDEKSDSYYGFIRFKTAEELEKIILDELAEAVNGIFETAAENLHMSFGLLDKEIYNGQDMDDVTKLTRELGLIREEYRKKGERLELLLNVLSGALLDKKYKSS